LGKKWGDMKIETLILKNKNRTNGPEKSQKKTREASRASLKGSSEGLRVQARIYLKKLPDKSEIRKRNGKSGQSYPGSTENITETKFPNKKKH